MKKHEILALATAIMFGLTVTAQNQTPPPPRNGELSEMKQGERPQMTPEKRADRLAQKLVLSDVEKKQVQALFEKRDAKRNQNVAELKKNKEEKKNQFEADRKIQDTDLEKIIGKEKFQKYQNIRTEHMGQMKERRSGMMNKNQHPRMGREMQKRDFKQTDRPQVTANERAEKMAKQVGLTEIEKAKIQEVFEKQDSKCELQKAEIKKIKEEQKIKFENDRKTQDAEIETIIGKEKFQKLVTLRTEHKDKMDRMREKNPNDSTTHNKKSRPEKMRMNDAK